MGRFMQRIADTGLLKAALDGSHVHHAWAARELAAYAPFHTCEPVLDELAFLLDDPRPGLILLARGDVILEFSIATHAGRLLELLNKYADRQMQLADACLVRMSELVDAWQIWTVDEQDFRARLARGDRLELRCDPAVGCIDVFALPLLPCVPCVHAGTIRRFVPPRSRAR